MTIKRSLATIDRRNERMIYLVVGADSEAERIPVYNQLLSNSSPKFKRLVESMDLESADLPLVGVSKKIMSILIDYIYRTFQDGEASLPITEGNVHELLFAANKYDLDDVKSLCCDFLEFMEINEENCIQLFVKTPESTGAYFKKKCLEFVLSSLSQLFTTQPFFNLTSTQLAFIVKEGRVQEKCSEDLLSEVSINWINSSSRSREISQTVMKDLIDQFRFKRHKRLIIQALYEIPHPELQHFAFGLLMKLCTDEAETSRTIATNITFETGHYDDPSTSESCGCSNDEDNDDSANNSNDSNSSNSMDNGEAAAAHVTPLKRPSSSNRGNHHDPSFSQQNKNSLLALSPAAKRIKTTETAAEINNEEQEQSTFNPSIQENVLQNTLVTPEAEISSRPLLSISLQRKKPRITMVTTFNNQKTKQHFQNISKLSEELESLGNDRKIWLSVWDAPFSLEEIVKFLDNFSSDILNLTLTTCQVFLAKMSPADFLKLLCKLPNLNYLCLTTIPSEWKSHKKLLQQNFNSSESDGSFSLPKVKTISFSSCPEFYPEFVKSLLQLMPNLDNVHHFPLNCTSVMAANDELDKIKSVDFYSSPTANGKLTETLSQFGVTSQSTKLEFAVVHFKLSSQENAKDLYESCCESLSKILRNNQSTIKQLVIEPLPFPELLKYPEMQAVKKLELSTSLNWKKCEDATKEVKFFGEGFNVHRKFPNLVKVTFNSKNCGLDELLMFFPEDAFNQQYFRGVTCLKIDLYRDESVDALEKTAKLFPDVTSFVSDGDISWLEMNLPHILRLWPKLISLKLKLEVFYHARSRAISEYPLDPVFTGVPAEKCNELRQHNDKIDIDLASYRQNFGISTMTDLKELTLIFYGEYLKTYKVMPLLSHVSSLYGFQCLPDLKVTCAIPWDNKDNEKIREMLNPIEKYVTFKPNYY